MSTAIVTGGAGFLGSHLCERLLAEGIDVFCFDTLLTGSRENIRGFEDDPRFRYEPVDVTKDFGCPGTVDYILHFASPASPRDYLEHPIHTLKVGALGTLHALSLAREKGATLMLASTSEVYGDPQVHPQPEDYWGNVNPVGPRGVYDEAKRYAEAMAMAFHRAHGTHVRIARIFNTYGPRMRMNDGRAVPTFVRQALGDEPMTVHGDGSQTRSLCFVDDMVDGLYRFLRSDRTGPINLGNPHEVTIDELARRIRSLTGSSSTVRFVDRPVDDPEVRCPDITVATSALGWRPEVPLDEGLRRTIAWARLVWPSPELTAT
jgi:dTDP-glucose 4,6-dehydratase